MLSSVLTVSSRLIRQFKRTANTAAWSSNRRILNCFRGATRFLAMMNENCAIWKYESSIKNSTNAFLVGVGEHVELYQCLRAGINTETEGSSNSQSFDRSSRQSSQTLWSFLSNGSSRPLFLRHNAITSYPYLHRQHVWGEHSQRIKHS